MLIVVDNALVLLLIGNRTAPPTPAATHAGGRLVLGFVGVVIHVHVTAPWEETGATPLITNSHGAACSPQALHCTRANR